MSKEQLLEIISNGESSGVEFKSDNIRPEQLATEVVAMANLRGGMVLLGVEDDGSISGVRRKNLKQWVVNIFYQKIHPMILPFHEEVLLEGRRVAVISFAEGTSKPYVVRNKDREDVYIWIGSTSRLATREQRSPRNPLLVDVMKDYGYIDARGMGVRTKIVPLMKAHTGREPVFESTDDYLKIVLFR